LAEASGASSLSTARVFVTGRSAPDHERLDEQVTGIRCDHRVDTQVEAVFKLIVRQTNAIDILVNSVWGGYERMVEDGNFTWAKPFWEQPLWRWDAMFNAGARAHYQASQLAAPTMIAQRRAPEVTSLWSYETRSRVPDRRRIARNSDGGHEYWLGRSDPLLNTILRGTGVIVGQI
jgi:NAD(P)-dependent dehydrogenase (short-subunit alcohol dehydrogenase family)